MSYRPFIETLKRYQRIRCVWHLSGPLLDWLSEYQPDYLNQLRELVQKGQIEIMGGAYYEPIYGSIPQKDLIGQIEYMNKRCQEFFGITPEGAWLTERVWDPEIAPILSQTGMKYTVLDDYHFERAGLGKETFGYYTTSKDTVPIDVFSSSRKLRYLIPFRLPNRLLSFVSSLDLKPHQSITFADDCEKFGFWPGTYDWVYGKKWLSMFFEALASREWLDLYTFSEFRKRFPSQGEIGIPHSSYAEMMEWSGGRFYNFLTKYPESGYMHQRMKLVSKALDEGPAPQSQEARLELYKAQCNCAYWHGVFGGLYLSHLRKAIYEHLIRAESFIPEKNGRKMPSVSEISLDSEKKRLVVLRHRIFNAYFDPQEGGALVELDDKPLCLNITNTLTRQPESYHAQLLKGRFGTRPGMFEIHRLLGVKEKNLKPFLIYDHRRRYSLVDHWVSKPLSVKAIHTNSFHEEGDFVQNPYTMTKGSVEGVFSLERLGWVCSQGKQRQVRIRKTISGLKETSLVLKYELENTEPEPVDSFFAVEFNFLIHDNDAVVGLDESEVRHRVFRDPWNHKASFAFTVDKPAHLVTSAIETVSESEGGMEKTFQALSIFWEWKILLEPSSQCSFQMEFGAHED